MDIWGSQRLILSFCGGVDGYAHSLPSLASIQLNTTSTQTKVEVSLIYSFRQANQPPTRKSSDMELCLNLFSARELKFGTATHYTNLIKII